MEDGLAYEIVRAMDENIGKAGDPRLAAMEDNPFVPGWVWAPSRRGQAVLSGKGIYRLNS